MLDISTQQIDIGGFHRRVRIMILPPRVPLKIFRYMSRSLDLIQFFGIELANFSIMTIHVFYDDRDCVGVTSRRKVMGRSSWRRLLASDPPSGQVSSLMRVAQLLIGSWWASITETGDVGVGVECGGRSAQKRGDHEFGLTQACQVS